MATNGTSLVDVEKLKADLDSKDASSTYTWTFENGRRYASSQLGHYYMPNDEPEIQRLNEQHWILTQVRGGYLHFAPLQNNGEGARILDIGCGSGIWCTQMSEDYPSAMIIGMDVSPIQPASKPPNVEWITQDMEGVEAWPFPEEYFDLVHLSLVHGCVEDWGKMLEKIVRYLKPGGWVEHQEFSLCRQYQVDLDGRQMPMSDDPDQLPPLFRWNRLMEQAAIKRGRILQLGPKLAEFQKDAGFENVEEKVFAHRWGTWMEDPKERDLGARTMLNAMSGMEGFTTTMFTKVLGWSVEDTQSFIKEIKRDMRDDSIRKVMDIHVVYGQKPKTTARGSGPPVLDAKSQNVQIGVGLALGVGVLLGAAAASMLAMSWLRRR